MAAAGVEERKRAAGLDKRQVGLDSGESGAVQSAERMVRDSDCHSNPSDHLLVVGIDLKNDLL